MSDLVLVEWLVVSQVVQLKKPLQAYQFIIQLNDGKSIAVLQEEVKGLSVGDDVTILASGNNTRIIPQG